jgi:hypothetical protein
VPEGEGVIPFDIRYLGKGVFPNKAHSENTALGMQKIWNTFCLYMIFR